MHAASFETTPARPLPVSQPAMNRPMDRQRGPTNFEAVGWSAVPSSSPVPNRTHQSNPRATCRLEDFLPAVGEWNFDWIDLKKFFSAADSILETAMVDRDPLPRWTFDRITLLGDAAHPMLPRGSNGAAQAIIDAITLAECLATAPETALQNYEARRREVTAHIVLTNRTQPPDSIINEVHRRTGGKPFKRLEDVISKIELANLLERYKKMSEAPR